MSVVDTASSTRSSSSAVMRRWLGTLPHVCHPTPARPRYTLHGLLDVGTAGEPQPALEGARKEGRAEQDKREMQSSKAELS